MASHRIPLVAGVLLALAGMATPVAAQTAGADASIAGADGIPKRTEAAVKDALMKISASPTAEAALMDLVRAHDSAKVRAMLIQYGVKPGELRNVVIDALGVSQGARKLVGSTIYFDVIPQGGNVPAPVGLVHIGGQWVDWNEYEASWYWWW